ncbi:MAG TPA: ATP-binding protein [Tepidisphaeraceae bacterium]|nr:ATP-binding protein [Tepidisphaeraceae bacterium]
MREKNRGPRARGIRLAIVVAFVAHAVCLFYLLPLPNTYRPPIDLTRFEIAAVSCFGLISLAAGVLGFRVFLRRRFAAETRLARSEAFARATVDALPTHIAIIDEWGAIASTNRSWRAFAEAAGAAPAAVGEGTNYLAECDRAASRGCREAAQVGTAIRDVLRGGRADEFSLEYAAHTPARRRWFLARVTRFPGPGRAHAVVAHEDVTARKLAEEQHEKAKQEAEAANAAKSAFIANTSHEIRTPMNAILGYADMLLDPAATPDDRRHCVKVIRRNGEHLLAIINDILDISKIEAAKMTAERIPCDLPQLVADVIGLVKPKAVEKGLRFRVTFDEVIPRTVTTDPVRARQVLVNLIGNAIKFTHAGEVHLHVAREIAYFSQTLRFTITDTGVGMTDEQVGRLFQPFTQADASTTRKYGGTGLGLTISRKLAQLLGGDISAASEAGRGSTFAFWLDAGPRDGAELVDGFTEAQLELPEPDAEAAARQILLSGHVLLAEDGEDNQHLLTVFLEQAGATVTLATNGADAVRLALAGTFDLVLMDMQMPVMDGYRAAGELRQAGYDKPVIALTAHAMAEDRTRCLAAGCTDYLTKPIDRVKLLETCRQHLPNAVYPLRGRGGDASSTAESPALSDSPAPPLDESAEYPIATTGAASPLAAAPDSTAEDAIIPLEVSLECSPTSADAPPAGGPLRSVLADDPRVRRVLDGFVRRLPQRVDQLARSMAGHDVDALLAAVHQLRGAGAGYGFGPLSDLAGRAEDALKVHADLERAKADVDELIALIRTVDGYNPAAEMQRA